MVAGARLGSVGWTYIDAFVGRHVELQRLEDLAARGERLVTVVGPGGIGKTRLAAEHVRRLAGSGDPAALTSCDLIGVGEESGILRLLALALEVAAPGDGALLQAIGGALRRRGDALLVLDNCEHAVAALAPVVLGLLELAPRARILATSRQILAVRGECVLDLGPLGLPDGPDDAESSDAFTLLLDRTRRARFEGELACAERGILVGIARALEGVPLAIELAAPRVALLGPATVLARLHRRLGLLTGGVGDRPGHHRALRDALEWSWEILAPVEQRFLAHCAVFRGGFTLAAAEAVASGSIAPGAPPAVDLLQALQERSLVQARALLSPAGEHRFGLLEMLRELVEEKLAPADTRAAELRHARHYAAELEALSEALADGAEDALTRLDLEKENLRALVDRMLAPRPGETAEARGERAFLAARALGAVEPALLPFTWAQLAAHLDGALAALPSGEAEVRARALLASGNVRWRLGPLARARADFEESAVVARRAGDRRLEGRAVAGASMIGGNVADSLRALEQALAIHREVGDRRFEASTLLRLGLQRGEHGDTARAREHFEEARIRARLLGDARLEAQTLAAIGVLLAEDEEHGAAIERLAEALMLVPGPAPQIACALGMVQHLAGQLDAALATFQRGVEGAVDRGDRYSDGLCRGFAAVVDLERGDLDRASVGLEGACARFEQLAYGRYAAFFLAHLATLEARGRRPAPGGSAARLAFARSKLDLDGDPFHVALDLQAACIEAIASGGSVAARWAAARSGVLARAGDHLIVELRVSLRIADGEIRAAVGALPAFADLRVHAEGHWFAYGGDPVDLRERTVLRRLLARLAEQRRDTPGAVVPAESLIGAGWPAEKMSHASAKNRLKVHVAALRDLGLRGVLLSSDGGYLLDPGVPIQIVA